MGRWALHFREPGRKKGANHEQEDVRSPAFVQKYKEKGEKVELEEGGKKSVVLKVIREDSEP